MVCIDSSGCSVAMRVAVEAAARFVAAGVVSDVDAMDVVVGVAVVVVVPVSPSGMPTLQITDFLSTLTHLLLWSPHS